MVELLEYLKKQRAERAEKVAAYQEALDDYVTAQRRLESFGDMSETEAEIGQLDKYIEQVTASTATVATENVEATDGGVADEVVTEEA